MENYNGGGFYRLPLCSHLLQQSLRSFCTDSQWLYAVFWRILPRNFPPPKWEAGGYLDRTKANKRNWILVWEDGFCDFASATASAGLQPDLFFKMSHEVYNYGEGLMGKVSAENGHKWIQKDPSQAETTPSWQNTIDPQPRTWEPQFKAGIQTIMVIAVREGLVQLGSTHKIQEDLNFIAILQRKFNSLLVTLSASSPSSPVVGRESIKSEAEHHDQALGAQKILERQMSWNGLMVANPGCQAFKGTTTNNFATIMPSMTSLQALLSKLPSVTSPPSTQITHITTSSNSNHNAISSFPYHLSPLIRSLSAPQGDFWLQEPPNASPSIANVRSLDPHLCHPAHQPTNLSQSFMPFDWNVSPEEEYSFMSDLMSG